MTQRPQTIIAERNRRSGRRIMTLRNGARFLFALILVIVAVSLYSEIRGDRSGSFGRLYDRRTREIRTEAKRAPMVVVEEQPIPERVPDPMLVDSLDREEILGVEPPIPHPTDVATAAPAAAEFSGVAPLGQYDGAPQKPGKSRFEIVGGAGGVRVRVK